MDRFIRKKSASCGQRKTKETLDSGPGFAQYPPFPRDAESAGLCSADNDIIVLLVFAVTKYPRETSSHRACLFWLRAIELLISDGEEKPGE